MAIPLAALALFEAVPALLKLFGQTRPAEVVERVVDVAKTVTGAQDADSALSIIKADPSKMIEYHNAVEERAITWARIWADDIKDARDHEEDMIKAGHQDDTKKWLVSLAFGLLFALLAIAIWSTNMNEYVKGIITLILGRALGWVEQIYSYHYGTTRANRAKDETISNLSKE